MLFSMLVSLYTSRVVLQTLGVEDYGIYDVVGGVVGMLSLISGSLSSAISRFITFELGKGDIDKLKRVFSTSVSIQLTISTLVIVLAELVGVWFLNNKMIIPSDRLLAANWIFQFSVLTFAVGLISVPYNAVIIAHEKMKAFAYIGIFEVLAKLLIVFSLLVSPIDRLILYGLLLMILSIIVRIIYGIYCKRNFAECSYSFIFDKALIKDMSGFVGWNFIGSSSGILRDYGGNILINLFLGPSVNAARGIATQVCRVVSSFANNFMTAVNPQITKSYSVGNIDYMSELIYRSARYSFYLLLLLSLPFIVNADFLLSLWLEDVPEYTVIFVQLALVLTLSESLANPLVTAVLATGRIRSYQIIIGGMQLLNLPISYLCLRMSFSPECIFVVAIIISVCCVISRVLILRWLLGFPVHKFLIGVYANVVFVFLLSLISPVAFKILSNSNLYTCIICCALSILSATIAIYSVGCNKMERFFIRSKLNKGIKSKICGR